MPLSRAHWEQHLGFWGSLFFSARPARHELTFMCPYMSLLKWGNLHPKLMETLKFSGRCWHKTHPLVQEWAVTLQPALLKENTFFENMHKERRIKFSSAHVELDKSKPLILASVFHSIFFVISSSSTMKSPRRFCNLPGFLQNEALCTSASKWSLAERVCTQAAETMGAAKGRAEPAAGNTRYVSNRRCKDCDHRSQSKWTSHISKEALASSSAERLLGRGRFSVAFCWPVLQPTLSLLMMLQIKRSWALSGCPCQAELRWGAVWNPSYFSARR